LAAECIEPKIDRIVFSDVRTAGDRYAIGPLGKPDLKGPAPTTDIPDAGARCCAARPVITLVSAEGARMYASFFGLRELPFNNTPDPRFFFSTPDHEEALASLIYAISEGKGFVLLTGEVGAGKTLVTRLMLRHFGETIAFACINNTQVTASDLLHGVCTEFDMQVPEEASGAVLARELQDYLLRNFASNRPTVLMLDEAQALSRDAFEQVRMIGNLEADDTKLLQIVIVGQPELRTRFEGDDMRQLRQRIFRSFHLPAMTREQTEGYIRHRLGVAGAQHPNIFDSSAVDVIYDFSEGLPRIINTVCDNAMLSAYASNRTWIDAPLIQSTLDQMMTAEQGEDAPAPRRIIPRRRATRPPRQASPADSIDDEIADNRQRSGEDSADLLQRLHQLEARMLDRYRQVEADALARYRDVSAETTDRIRQCGADMLDRLRTSESSRLSDARQTGLQLAEAGERLRPVLAKVVEAERKSGQQIELLRKFSRVVEEMMLESKRTASEAVQMLNAVQQARTRADETIAGLTEQTAKTGRLMVKFREIFGALEARAQALAGEESGSAADGSGAGGQPTGQKILKMARSFDRKLDTTRSLASEVRNLIDVVNAASTRPSPQDPVSASPLASNSAADVASAVRHSQLAQNVRALAALIE
jgi:type II secretory pathway predicted ATPase ExeA